MANQWEVLSVEPAAPAADPWAVVSVTPTGKKPASTGAEAARAAYARRQAKYGNRADNAGAAVINGMTFGALDKVTGAMNAAEVGVGNAFGRMVGQEPQFSAGEAYQAARDVTREEQARYAADHPVASGAANVMGSLKAPGVGAAAGWVGNAPNLISAIGRSAASGAAFTGGAAALNADGGIGDKITAGLKGAGVGAATGAALGPLARIGQSAGNAVVKPAAGVAKPVLDKMIAAKNAAYKAVDNAGIQYAAPGLARMAKDIRSTLDAENLNPIIHPKAAAAVDAIKKATANKNLTITQLDQLRQFVKSDVVGLADKGEKRLGRMIVDQIDNFIENAQPGDMLTGDAKTASSLIKAARDLNRKTRLLESVDTAVEKAKNRTGGTGSGGNIDNAIRQNLRTVMEKTPGLTPTEKAAFQQAVRGAPLQNVARSLGKMSPLNGGLPAILSTGGAAFAAPIAIPAAIATSGMKLTADAMTRGNVETLRKIIAGGGPAATAAIKVAKANPALAKALSRAGISLEAGGGAQVGRVSQPASAARP